ncbi:MAG: hypothetical protein LBT47_00175 [Deltaproteobacteria bacterium]|jgi:hypothetical protein|nr:hypothetical protein [Deltaproteobacteria bacterium]
MSPSAPHAIPNTRPSPPPVLTAEPDLEEPEVLLEPEIDDLDISETAAAVQAPPPKAPPTLRDTPVPNQSKIPTALTDDDIDVALDDTLGPVEVAVVAPAVARAAPSPPPSSTRPITPVGTNTPNQTVSQIRQTLEPTGDVNAAPSSLNPSETFMVPPTNLEEADLESANDLKDLPDLDSDDDTLDLGDGESLNLSDSLDDLDDE